MNITNFNWRDDVAIKLAAKHNVRTGEVEEAFANSPSYRKGRGGTYYLFGRTDAGRYVFVVFVYEGNGCARPVTARDMTRPERRLYDRSI